MNYEFTLRKVADVGIKIPLGTDAIGGGSPYVDIMLAAMRPGRPTEALTVEQAVKAYTQGSAEAELMGDLKGTIEAGKLADLAVLSQGIFTVPLDTLPATVSLMTIVDGRIVYDAGVLVVTPCIPGQGSCGCTR